MPPHPKRRAEDALAGASVTRPAKIVPWTSAAGWMHSPWERWRPNNGNVLQAQPRQKKPASFFVLACRSDYPPPFVTADRCYQPTSGHPGGGRQAGIVTLWLDGHTKWLGVGECQIAHLYGKCNYGEPTAGNSDGYMVPWGFTVTW